MHKTLKHRADMTQTRQDTPSTGQIVIAIDTSTAPPAHTLTAIAKAVVKLLKTHGTDVAVHAFNTTVSQPMKRKQDSDTQPEDVVRFFRQNIGTGGSHIEAVFEMAQCSQPKTLIVFTDNVVSTVTKTDTQIVFVKTEPDPDNRSDVMTLSDILMNG